MYSKPESIITTSITAAKKAIASEFAYREKKTYIKGLTFKPTSATCECGETYGIRGEHGNDFIRVAVCKKCANQ